jgi:hypothetical protein
MSNEIGSRVRYGEAFWRAHHEAWQQSALNQREYCEAHGIPLKALPRYKASIAHSLVWFGRGRDLFSPGPLRGRMMEMSNKIGAGLR